MASQRQRSNTNTDENEFKTTLEDGHASLDSSSESDNSDLETRHASMSKHVRKRVITNEKRQRQLKVKFKTFVQPNEINSKHSSSKVRTATLPASLTKRSWGGKKLTFQGMEAFVSRPRSLSSNEQPMLLSLAKSTDMKEDADTLPNELPTQTQASSEYLERKIIQSENPSGTLCDDSINACRKESVVQEASMDGNIKKEAAIVFSPP